MSEHLSLGDLIRRQREKLGLTQARLAELVGRSPSTIRSWERNLSLPEDEDSLFALGAVLDLADEEIRDALGGAYPAFETDQPTVPPAAATVFGSPGPPRVEFEIDASSEVPPESAAPPAVTPSIEAAKPASRTDDDAAAIEAVSSESASVAEKPGAGAGSPEAAGRPGDPDGVDASPTEVDTPQATAAEPYATPNPPRSTVAARPRVASYMDDPGEARVYRMRAILTTVIIVLLLLVLTWAFGEARDALGSLFGS